jgi:GNAT superfamily N-acetyltransferase
VDPEYQLSGIGAALVNAVEDRARQLGATELIGYAGVDVVGWVESLGWTVWGRGPTLLGQVEHARMGESLR